MNHRGFGRVAVGCLIVFCLLAMGAPSAAAKPSLSERDVVLDPEDQQNGALDLMAVYASESFAYNSEFRRMEGDRLHIRLEVRDMASYVLNTETRYEVRATIGGATHTFWAVLIWPCTANIIGSDGCPKQPAVSESNVATVIRNDGLQFNVEPASLGLGVGSTLTDVFAANAVRAPDGSLVWQDVAPSDQEGAPHGADEPTVPTGAGQIVLQGPFPFVSATPLGPLERFSVDGSEVKYEFEIRAHEGVKGELVWILFDTPQDWSVNPSHGGTGRGAIGQLTNLGDIPVLFAAGMYATAPTDRGTTNTTVMHVISSSGTHHAFDLVATVSGPRIQDPSYAFELVSPAKAERGEEVPIQVRVTRAGDVPLGPEERISFDFYRNGRYIETRSAAAGDDGIYAVDYAFGSHGVWTVEPFVASLRPSPHATFEVQVDKGGVAGVPGPGALAFVAALGVAAALTRRRAS